MVSTGVISQDCESYNQALTNYKQCISDIDEGSWSGSSKDNFVTQTNKFVNDFQSSIVGQFTSFSNAVDLYSQYKQAKRDSELLASKHAANKEEVTETQVEEAKNQVTQLENSIKNALLEVVGVKLEGARGEFVNYFQFKYSDSFDVPDLIKNTTIASSGCGPTSMAMVTTYLTGENVTPVDTARFVLDNGLRNIGYDKYGNRDYDGIKHRFFSDFGKKYNIDVESIDKYSENAEERAKFNAEEIKTNLQNDNPIIMLMGPGVFTSAAHFIVLRGVDENGKIRVADPNSEDRSKSDTSFDVDVFLSQGNKMWICR